MLTKSHEYVAGLTEQCARTIVFTMTRNERDRVRSMKRVGWQVDELRRAQQHRDHECWARSPHVVPQHYDDVAANQSAALQSIVDAIASTMDVPTVHVDAAYEFKGDANLLIPSSRGLKQDCDLCLDNKWVFVVSTGRSGSTTLAAMLGALPDTYISGENGGMASSLRDLYRKAKEMHFGRRNGPRFHETVEETVLLCDMQEYARDAIGATDAGTLGWKEIRYSRADLQFLKRLFPCARFVINVRRDVGAQAQSAFWKDGNDSERKLRTATDALLLWQSENADRSKVLYLEDFSKGAFDDLATWFGHACRYEALVHANANNSYASSVRTPRCVKP